MVVIGITGSLGTGKTSVASFFRKLGARVLDADRIARDVMKPSGECYRRIVRRFGPDVCRGRAIDRKKLAARVFADPQALKDLETIIHPAVLKRIKREIRGLRRQGSVKAVVVDVPLLFEAGWDRDMDVTITVRANRQAQHQRLRRGGKFSPREAAQRLKRQMPLSQKIRLSDYVIDNNGSFSETRGQVHHIWKNIMKKYPIGKKCQRNN